MPRQGSGLRPNCSTGQFGQYDCKVSRTRNTKRASSRPRDGSPLTSSEKRGTSQAPTKADHKKNLTAIRATAAESRSYVAQLQRYFAKMDKDTYRLLSRRLSYPISRKPRDVPNQAHPVSSGMGAAVTEIERLGSLERSWSHELLAMHTSLSHLVKALDASIRDTNPKHGPKSRELHREAICGLWRIWHHATGERAARTGNRNSPFYEFVNKALKIVWPGTPSSAGLIDQVCTQMRKKTP